MSATIEISPIPVEFMEPIEPPPASRMEFTRRMQGSYVNGRRAAKKWLMVGGSLRSVDYFISADMLRQLYGAREEECVYCANVAQRTEMFVGFNRRFWNGRIYNGIDLYSLIELRPREDGDYRLHRLDPTIPGIMPFLNTLLDPKAGDGAAFVLCDWLEDYGDEDLCATALMIREHPRPLLMARAQVNVRDFEWRVGTDTRGVLVAKPKEQR